MVSTKGWTTGAEHELVDWDRTIELPHGLSVSPKEYTIVNSTGIAVDSNPDPSRRLYNFGGEINTPPTESTHDQAAMIYELARFLPGARVNFRSELNLHVRVPGLRDDLKMLKRLANFNAAWLPRLLPMIDPLPKPFIHAYPHPVERDGAKRNWQDRKRMQHTVLVPVRLERQLAAATPDEFFRAEVPASKDGKPMWHCQPRAAINLRQMLETDTVEFRCWPGTLDEAAVAVRLEWCVNYLLMALEGDNDPVRDFEDNWAAFFAKHPCPQLTYDHAIETRFRATTHDGTLKKDAIRRNIELIESGQFDDSGLPNHLPLVGETQCAG